MKDYKAYATKDITKTMEAFHEWLQNETGLELDLRSVALAGSLRADFQASDFWKQHPDNYKNNVEANREAKAAEAAERAKAAAAKAQQRVIAAEAKLDAAKKAAAAKTMQADKAA